MYPTWLSAHEFGATNSAMQILFGSIGGIITGIESKIAGSGNRPESNLRYVPFAARCHDNCSNGYPGERLLEAEGTQPGHDRASSKLMPGAQGRKVPCLSNR